jgi:trk system potassium uptake protein
VKQRLIHPSAVLAGTFAAAVLLGTCLLMLPAASANGQSAPWLVALFTATSAVCVTGLALVDTGTYWSGLGQSMIMAMFQLGGFGMMTAATLLGLLVNQQMRMRSKMLLQAETRALGVGDVRSIAKLVLGVTVLVEASVGLVLALRFWLAYDMSFGTALWQGMFHSVSAFNNAGFSTFSDSVMRFVTDAWILLPLSLAILVGGFGFPVLHEAKELLQKRQRGASLHLQMTVWASVVLVVGGTLAFLWAEWDNPATLAALNVPARLLAAFFTSVSARTAGFNAVDIGALSLESLNLHYLLMFIGAGSASTGGGVKMTTVFILVLIVWNELRGHADVEFQKRRIAGSVQRQALTVLVLSGAVVTVATLAIVPLTTLPYEKVLFEVVSAFSTVGLSTGITAQLPPAGQMILIALMYIGRVGIVTLAASLAFNHARRGYRYPEEKPIVG